MADVGLDGADGDLPWSGAEVAERGASCCPFDRVADAGSRAVRLELADRAGVHVGRSADAMTASCPPTDGA